MPMRVGEMMVVVRAQDFASRTLRRVSGELSHLSRAEQLAQRRRMAGLRLDEQIAKRAEVINRGRALSLIKQRQMVADALADTGPGSLRRSWKTQDINRFNEFTRSMGNMDRTLRKLDPSMQKLSQRMDGLRASGVSLADRTRILDTALAGNMRQLRRVGAEIGITRQQIVGLEKAIRALPVEHLDSIGRAMSGIGRTMQLFGAVGTIALGLAASQAAEFSKSISLAATQARDINAPVSQVATRIEQLTNGFTASGEEIGGVMDLMRQYPADAQAMADASYEIFSSMDIEEGGIIDVAKGLGLLEDANKLAVAGGVDLAEATSAMVTVLNNFNPALDKTTQQYDTMFDIVRFGRMRLSDFNIMMNKIAPAAADAGMALEDVGGAMAYLTTVMPSQRMVATGISRLIEALRHPDIIKGLHMFGVEVEDLVTGKMRPLDDILKDIAETFPLLRTGQKSAAEFFRELSAAGRGGGRGVIFTQEGRRALSEIITHFDEYADAQTRIEQNTGEFGATLEAQMQTIGVQWDIFMNRVRAVVLAIGQDAVPAFAELGKVLERFLKFWEGLDEGTRQAIVRFAVFGSAAVLLGGILLSVVGSFIVLEAGFRKLLGSGKGVGVMLRGLWTVFSRLAALGAITMIIHAKMTGEAGAKALLMGALMGAVAGGQMGGVWGALAGGIIVPVTMKIMAEDPIKDVLARQVLEATQSRDRKWRQYGRYAASQIQAGMKDIMSAEEFFAFQRQFGKIEDKISGVAAVERNRDRTHNQALKEGKDNTNSAADATKKYKDKLGDYYKALQVADEKQKNYNKTIKDWNRNLAQAAEDATDAAIDSLRNMYMEMEQLNKQAFGELFQGPWLTSETFDLAKEWGIQAQIEDMIKDLRDQNTMFAQWRSSLDKLFKKGLPREFIKELQQMGPEEGQNFVNQIIAATPKQRNTLIAEWKKRNAAVKAATKMDFTSEITAFKKAGGDMGKAMIMGFEQAGVAKWFDGWVQTTFPSVINAAVNQAVADWKAANPRPTRPREPIKPTPPSARAVGDTDNSKTVTVNQTFHGRREEGALGHPGTVSMNLTTGQVAQLRHASFIIRNATKGLIK
jgi:TP901 family phage tail tape measure protein